jgi:hypothetical protein
MTQRQIDLASPTPRPADGLSQGEALSADIARMVLWLAADGSGGDGAELHRRRGRT